MIIDSFDGQKENEEIVAAFRQHPWVLARSGFIAIVVILIGSVPMAFWPADWSWIPLFLSVVVAVSYLSKDMYLWFNTIYIVTDRRVFAVCQKTPLMRTTSEVPLVNIQNAAHTRAGAAQMMFNYGTVGIQTAGPTMALELKNVANPYQVQQIILQDQEK